MIKWLLLFTGVCLHALTLDEALQRAQTSNFQIKEQDALANANDYRRDTAQSAFLPTLDLTYRYSKSDTPNRFTGADTSTSAVLTLAYNLFNGFSDLYMMDNAQFNYVQSLHECNATAADVTLNVKQSFIAYLRAQRDIAIAEESLRLLERQLDDAKAFYAQGIFAKNDYLQVQVEHARTRQQLLDTHRNLRHAFSTLRHHLGDQLREHEKPDELTWPLQPLQRAELEHALYTNRSELLAMQARLDALNAEHKALESAYYPTIDADIRYQKAGDTPWPNGGQTFTNNDETSINLTMEWTLYSGGTDQSIRKAHLQSISAVSFAMARLRSELALQLDDAYEAYTLARSQLDVAKERVAQAEENYRITQNQYKASIATTALLLEARRYLTDAQAEAAKAHYDIFDAIALLQRITQAPLF